MQSETPPPAALYQFKELLPPPDRSWADPFPVVSDNRYFVFFEEQRFGEKGHISLFEMSHDGKIGPSRPVLTRDYHLSYPFVFRWRDCWYMIPETAEGRAVELFSSSRFPDKWEYVCPILSGIDATDATIVQIDQLWWLFTAVMLPGSDDATALHLFFAPSPLGPWAPHLRNPVRIDVRGARPAGRVFKYGNHWYRPGQDGAPRYGTATIVHRIDEISPTEFQETAVSRVTATWRPGLLGTHTLNHAGGLTMVDANRMVGRISSRK